MKQTNCVWASRGAPAEIVPTVVSPMVSSDVPGACRNEGRYVSRRELRSLFPVSDMTIFRWTNDPEVGFPKPVKW